MSVRPDLACSLQECIAGLWKSGDFCDFTVTVENISFQCHRFILAACSGFFQGLFRSQMKECQEHSVELHGVTKDAFNTILNFLYKGRNGLNSNNVIDVWSASVQLQIQHLIAECESFVTKNISMGNCFRIFSCGKKFSSDKVLSCSYDFFTKHFGQVRSTNDFLELPFDDFYKILLREDLPTKSEDSVLETIIHWVKYEDCLQSASHNTDEIIDCNSRRPETKDLQVAFKVHGNCADFNSNNSDLENMPTQGTKTLVGTCAEIEINNAEVSSQVGEQNIDLGATGSISIDAQTSAQTSSQIGGLDIDSDTKFKFSADGQTLYREETKTSMCMLNPVNQILKNNEATPEKRQTEAMLEFTSSITSSEQVKYNRCDRNGMDDRWQRLLTLLSACRLYLVKPAYLRNLLKKSELLQSNKEAYDIIFEALMYILHVEYHHDTWPVAAVHRLSSDMKHVMVYIYDKKVMSYSLDLGSFNEVADLPGDCQQVIAITVFDNILYMEYFNKSNVRTLSMLVKERIWIQVNTAEESTLTTKNVALLAHGSDIYGLTDCGNQSVNCFGVTTSNQSCLVRCSCVHGFSRGWSTCWKLIQGGDCLVRFKEYVIILCTENTEIIAQCFNTKTGEKLTVKTLINGPSQGLVSFTHLEDVFLLRNNGFMYKIHSTDDEPIKFEFVMKLWNGENNLRGCVVYKKQLFVICLQDLQFLPNTIQVSLPGVFEKLKIVKLKSETLCLPAVIPGCWFTTKEADLSSNKQQFVFAARRKI